MHKLSLPLLNFVRISVLTTILTVFGYNLVCRQFTFFFLSQFNPTCQVFVNSCRQVLPSSAVNESSISDFSSFQLLILFRVQFCCPDSFGHNTVCLQLSFHFQSSPCKISISSTSPCKISISSTSTPQPQRRTVTISPGTPFHGHTPEQHYQLLHQQLHLQHFGPNNLILSKTPTVM